ncbi:holin-like protein [Clostridium punense]|uniref:Holin-like protein n=1 Tax=Clostridium punense TaxID=1054297 RepID=A0ABS4K8Y1_9CLOT|nr:MULTISPECIES: CidA/LrgA family protein [Clostridium]EQB89259.1 hypothetical protein M918_21105 [Clostridium sp. BL8]MBP2024234.1 holin-like protein [Clostridium punense]
MKIFKELTIILFITFLSESISKGLSLPIPGSILGMLILLTFLLLKIVRTESIKILNSYLLDNLAFFFLPAGVGIISSFDLLKGNTLKILIVITTSSLVVLLVTGYTVQGLISLQNRKKSS